MFFEKRKNLIKLLNLKLDEIESWNRKTFKNATLAGQLAKLEEEFREYQNEYSDTDTERLELADVFIVIGGLRRFNSLIGKAIYETYIENAKTKDIEILIDNIDSKMKINNARKWHKTDKGNYHH